MAQCKISSNSNGSIVALNDNGDVSKLFSELLERFSELPESKRHNKAFAFWGLALDENFQELTGLNEDTAGVDDLINYVETREIQEAKLSRSERFELEALMSRTGITSLSQLSGLLNQIFQRDNVDLNLAISSGLYTLSDIESLDLAKLYAIRYKINSEILRDNDFEVEPQEKVSTFRDSRFTNLLGMSVPVTIQDIHEMVVEKASDLQSTEEIRTILNNLPFDEVLEKFDENPSEFMKFFAGLKKIEVSHIEDGVLTRDISKRKATMRNTFPADVNMTPFRAMQDYFQNIPPAVFGVSAEEVRKILENLEKEYAETGVDIIGLKNLTSQDQIIDLLSTANQALTQGNPDLLADKLDALLSSEANIITKRVPLELQNKNLVVLNTTLSNQELFEQHGLLQVGDNLYQKVSKTEDIQNLYDYLIEQVQKGKIVIPDSHKTFTKKDDITTIQSDLESWLKTKDTGLGFRNERAAGYQLIFEHKPLKRTEKDNILALDQMNTEFENYVKTEFISDFYWYQLQEKLKDSYIYRKVLSKFDITENEITLNGDLQSLDGIEFRAQMDAYIRLSRNNTLKGLLENKREPIDTELLTAINDKQSISEYLQPIRPEGDFLITGPNSARFVRRGNETFEKVGENRDGVVYSRIISEQNPHFYTTEYYTNKDQKLIDQHLKTATILFKDTETVAQKEEKAGVNTPFFQNLKKKAQGVFQVGQRPQPQMQIIGVNNSLTNEDKKSLNRAQELKRQGVTKEEIYSQTRWLQTNQGQWVREIGDLKFIPTNNESLQEEVEHLYNNKRAEYNLNEWFDFSEFKTRTDYTNTAFIVEYKESKENKVYGEASKNKSGEYKITVKIEGTKDFIGRVLGGESYGYDNIRRFDDEGGASKTTVRVEKSLESLINHELQHILQKEGKRKAGSSQRAVIDYFHRKNKEVIDKAGPRNYIELASVLGEIYNIKDFLSYTEDIYRNSIGERQATEVERRLNNKDGLPEDFSGAYNIDITDVEDNKANFQIIGEQGAQNMEAYKQSLDRAKQLEEQGTPIAEIERRTGWYKFKGQWRTLSQEALKDFVIKDNTPNKVLTLKEVLGNENSIFTFYPEMDKIKVVFLDTTKPLNGIEVPVGAEEANGWYSKGHLTVFVNRLNAENEQDETYILGHEVSHIIQDIEGLPKGGGLNSVLTEAMSILGIKGGQVQPLNLYNSIVSADKTGLTPNQQKIVQDSITTLKALVQNDKQILTKQYRHIVGEIDAKVVEQTLKARDRGEGTTNYSDFLKMWANSENIDLNNVYLLGNGEVQFLIDQEGVQQGKSFYVNISAQNLAEIARQNSETTLGQLVTLTGARQLIQQDLTSTPVTFNNSQENANNEASAVLLLSGDRVQGIKFNISEADFRDGEQRFKDEFSLLLAHELQHIYDIEKGLPRGGSINRVKEALSEFKGDILGEYIGNSGQDGRRSQRNIEMGVYLSLRGEVNARRNALEEMGVPQGVINRYEPIVAEDLKLTALEDIKNIKAEDLSRYEEIGLNYMRATVSPSRDFNYSSEIVNEIIQRLKQTGLANNVFILSPQQLQQKLQEIGVTDPAIQRQIVAWHGSPHSFKKFTTAAMGTGEGNQAFGWGLYFTDLEGIARNYAKALSNRKDSIRIEVDGTFPMNIKANDPRDFSIDARNELFAGKNPKDVAKTIEDKYGVNDETRELLRILKNKNVKITLPQNTSKNLYKVSLHTGKTPDQYTWLEWDKPVSRETADKIKQWISEFDPEKRRVEIDEEIDSFRERLTAMEEKTSDMTHPTRLGLPIRLVIERWDKSSTFSGVADRLTLSEMGELKNIHDLVNERQGIPNVEKIRERVEQLTGKELYSIITNFKGGKKQASLFLLEIGIDGIKYPAESISRGATSDTARGFNYVVFDENVITIEDQIQFQKQLEDNGITLTTTGFVFNNDVYLNNETLSPEVSLHEFSHLFLNWSKQNRPELYQRGLRLVQEELNKPNSVIKDTITFVKTNQPNLQGEQLQNEILAQLTGERGQAIINSKKNSDIKQWLLDLWQSIKEALGILSVSPEQLSKMTISEYADAMTTELLKGERIGTPTETGTNFQIIGEKGAAQLDAYEESTIRLDNLAVAREMEASLGLQPEDWQTKGKKRQEKLKLLAATGWQRNADLTWGYEIDDVKLSDTVVQYLKNPPTEIKIMTLDKVLVGSDIFKAYPHLSNMSVELYKSDSPERGYYDVDFDTVHLNLNAGIEVGSTLFHEVQHSLQILEGFNEGGDVFTLHRIATGDLETTEEIKDKLTKKAKTTLDELLQKKNVFKGMSSREIEFIKEASQGNNLLGILRAMLRLGDEGRLDMEVYKNLIGETQAANVQYRMNLTPQQRRETLFEDTEDVAREDQIFLRSGITGEQFAYQARSLEVQSHEKRFIQESGFVMHIKPENPESLVEKFDSCN